MSDPALMQAIQEGDEHALHQLMRQYMPMMYAYIWRMVGNRADAEELCQETFIKVWNHAKQWRVEKGALSVWLHRIAHNCCMDFFRKNAWVTVSLDHVADVVMLDQQDTLYQLELQQHITRLLLQLPERQRSALLLCYYQGLSNQEAATVLNLTVNALESLLARARRTLKPYHESSTF